MNVPVDYDDKIECRNTHPDLLPTKEVDEKGQYENGTVLKKAVGLMLLKSVTNRAKMPVGHCRSVLRNVQKGKSSTRRATPPEQSSDSRYRWSAPSDMVSSNTRASDKVSSDTRAIQRAIGMLIAIKWAHQAVS